VASDEKGKRLKRQKPRHTSQPRLYLPRRATRPYAVMRLSWFGSIAKLNGLLSVIGTPSIINYILSLPFQCYRSGRLSPGTEFSNVDSLLSYAPMFRTSPSHKPTTPEHSHRTSHLFQRYYFYASSSLQL